MSSRLPTLERFLHKIAIQPDGCWLWIASKRKRDGYGDFRVDGHTQLAHRWAYVYFVGPIPEGLELDHTCRNPSCVHPEHLEPVTHRVNHIRGAACMLNSHRTSQYVGVCWDKEKKKWQAQIRINGCLHRLGRFTSENDARQAYLNAVDRLKASL